MYLSAQLVESVERAVGVRVRDAEPVGGGCIANACRVDTETGPFFLKWSADAEVAQTFDAEAAGLRALAEAHSPLLVPGVLVARGAGPDGPGILLAEWIEQGREGSDFWEGFGAGLAALHRHTGPRFGFEIDNFVGRLPQDNGWADDWATFFRERRLAPQVETARRSGVWQRGWDPHLDRLYARLEDVLPPTPEASVLHGDLWSGNFLVAAGGAAVLVDPAAYYGHREADLAMTELFGGFDDRFYAAYREAWPLEPGYAQRRDVYNLYHLINHLNHFGGSYVGAVTSTLRRLS